MREFLDTYFNINLKDYSNLGVDFNISITLLFFFLGICVAAFFINHHRTYMASMVKQLFRHGAMNEESAKTLNELGLGGVGSLKRALARGGQLTKLVRRVGEEKMSYEEYMRLKKEKKLPPEEKIDFNLARFFVDPQNAERARRFYENNNSSVIKTVLICVLILAVYFCLMLVMPSILSLLDGIVGRINAW